MPGVIDIFTSKSFLPVEVTVATMEIIEQTTGLCKNNDQLFVEIGENRHSTAADLRNLLDGVSIRLLDTAIEEECEFIMFFH